MRDRRAHKPKSPKATLARSDTLHREAAERWKSRGYRGDGASEFDAAYDFLRTIISNRVDALPVATAILEAEKLTHPDKPTGNRDDFQKVQDARRLLLS